MASITLPQIVAANKRAGGKFFTKGHLDHLREWHGTHEVLEHDGNVIVRTTFPKSKEYPEGRSYDYRFNTETGELKPYRVPADSSPIVLQ